MFLQSGGIRRWCVFDIQTRYPFLYRAFCTALSTSLILFLSTTITHRPSRVGFEPKEKKRIVGLAARKNRREDRQRSRRLVIVASVDRRVRKGKGREHRSLSKEESGQLYDEQRQRKRERELQVDEHERRDGREWQGRSDVPEGSEERRRGRVEGVRESVGRGGEERERERESGRRGAGVRLVAARIPPYSKEEHATPPPARQPRVSLTRLTSCP